MGGLYFRGIRNRKGQTTVEFALILPVLLLLIFAIIEFGFILNAYVTVVSAAREGARYGIVDETLEYDEIRQRVKDYAGILDPDNFGTIGVERDKDKLTVTVPYDVPILDPIMGAVLGDSVTVRAKITMAME
ncbi:MAG: TadE/TadG family type IV pilus assembly protein [Caldicoprobacterales bacterium]|jgi:Flp pilus assembly protein TadG